LEEDLVEYGMKESEAKIKIVLNKI